MSRCFPYPPPGYTPSRASKDPLIESFKLQKEREKTKAQKKKEKRRERKEERDEIRKEANENTGLNSGKRKKKKEGREERKRRREERNEKPDPSSNKFDFPNRQIGKNILADREHHEGSGLTEEHNQPICMHLPSTSSESTENSSKRLGLSSPINVTRSHGNIIRILLSSKKQNLSDVSINEQQLCSTSGRTDIPFLSNRQPNFCASTEKTSDFVHRDFNRTVEKHIISASGNSQPTAPDKTGTPRGLDASEDSKKSTKSTQYENLIENWVPPSWQNAPSNPEDLDWLICNNDVLRPEGTQRFENDSVSCSSSSSLLQPRAQLLAGLDVYALPFTVPY